MDWSGRRAAAGAYIALFAANWVGVVLVLIGQLTGGASTVIAGIVPFAIGQAGLNALAFGMRRVPTAVGTGGAKGSDFGRAWHRLTLGLELGRAGRGLRN